MAVPAASAGFIAGRMTVTYGGSAVGQLGDGFTIEHTPRKRLITGDVFGPDTPQDAVFRGHDVFIEFDIMEYDAAASASIIWPYGSLGTATAAGRMDVASSLTAALVFSDTGVAAVPAEDKPHTLTADRAILAAGFPVHLLLEPALREIHIRMQLYPNTTGTGQFFVLDDGI